MANRRGPSSLTFRRASDRDGGKPKTMLRAGVVGAGWVSSERHIPSLLRTSGVELVGVYDHKIERARASAPEGAVATDDMDVLLDIGLDVVNVCTPPGAHADYVAAALDRGIHVFCEKPAALCTKDAKAMFAAADEAERLLCVSHNFLWSDAMVRARDTLQGAGKIQHIGGIQLSSDQRRLPTWHGGLRGGLLFDEIPHMLYILDDLLGGGLEVEHVRADWGTRTSEPRSCELLLRGSAGPAQISIVFGAPVSEWHVTVIAETTVVDIDLFRDVMVSTGSDGRHTAREVLGLSSRVVASHMAGFARAGVRLARGKQFWGHDRLIEAFISAVSNGAPSPVHKDRALAVVAATDAILHELGPIQTP